MHNLRSLPGKVFSALYLVCINIGFKKIEPGIDIGVDLGEEWGMAERLIGKVNVPRVSTNMCGSSFYSTNFG